MWLWVSTKYTIFVKTSLIIEKNIYLIVKYIILNKEKFSFNYLLNILIFCKVNKQLLQMNFVYGIALHLIAEKNHIFLYYFTVINDKKKKSKKNNRVSIFRNCVYQKLDFPQKKTRKIYLRNYEITQCDKWSIIN